MLLWFSDFFGYATPNLPAAWRYGNALLTSVHPEADNCSLFDCPAAGTIPHDDVLANRAWLVGEINAVLRGGRGDDGGVVTTPWATPPVPRAPSFSRAPPHRGGWPYPRKARRGCVPPRLEGEHARKDRRYDHRAHADAGG